MLFLYKLGFCICLRCHIYLTASVYATVCANDGFTIVSHLIGEFCVDSVSLPLLSLLHDKTGTHSSSSQLKRASIAISRRAITLIILETHKYTHIHIHPRIIAFVIIYLWQHYVHCERALRNIVNVHRRGDGQVHHEYSHELNHFTWSDLINCFGCTSDVHT